jgi:hypothetical protein
MQKIAPGEKRGLLAFSPFLPGRCFPPLWFSGFCEISRAGRYCVGTGAQNALNKLLRIFFPSAKHPFEFADNAPFS